ncbi:sugar ABC transporter permease [Kitasatospora nipponensis]|uniref:Sugar ABC transporter permease n=1 Tax=Kitasatospora nipponensis TaxID=258049 RepID=A0ABP4H9G4_9ACTN
MAATRAAAAPTVPAVRRRRLIVLAFLAPWLIGFAVFLLYPLVTTVYLSFTNSNMISPARWVGLRNYRYLLDQDPYVWQAIRNTGWLVAVMVPAQVLFALGVAMLTARLKAGAGIFRTLFYLPALAPPVAATVAFVFLFNPGTGPVDQLLRALGLPAPLWFSSEDWSKPALTLLALWGSGSAMVIFLAALLDVPAELYEAAELDGAGAWKRFVHITLPTIGPVLLFSAVTAVIAALQYFTQAMVAAQVAGNTRNEVSTGYPGGSTLTYSGWLYTNGFSQFHMGYACALAVLLFVATMLFTLVLLRRTAGFTPQEAGA